MTAPAIPPDPALPHVSRALDPMAMADVISRSLSRRGDVRLESCAIDRVRYRPGSRAVVQYAVQVEGGPAGERGDTWVTALLYPPARAEQVWGKLARKAGWVTEGFVGFDPELSLILQRFPFDRRLPSLPDLMRPAQMDLSDGGRRGWVAHPVRYRAGLGCAVRWDTPGAAGPARYVKVYRDDQGRSTDRTLRALRDRRRTADPSEGFDVPAPVAYLEDHRALVQEAVSGRSLADVVTRDDDPEPVVRRVACALAAWHAEPPVPASRTRGDEPEHLRRMAALVSRLRPSSTSAVARLLARAETHPDFEPATMHGDLKPDHVMVRPDGLSLLDLDSSAPGDPAMDVASMVARFTAMAVREPALGPRAAKAARAFLHSYLDRAPSGTRARVEHHLGPALLHEAAGCFRYQLPEWPDMMDELVRLACGTS